MAYLALYRKLRPKTFSTIVGQEAVVRILRNQLESKRINHAYLFCGTRGTGKTSTAKLFSKAINCLNPAPDKSPCGQCESCTAIESGRSMNVIEIDAASNNGVDNIREIREEVKYPPADGGTKVYIIDEVHMLSTGAFNALLKTLEEPPEKVIFILATTDPQKIPATILSRCQRLDFKRIPVNLMTDSLKFHMENDNVEIDDEALRYIASMSDGAMRDAQSLLDQCLSYFSGERITLEKVMSITGAVEKSVFFDLANAINSFESVKCLDIINDIVVNGRDIGQFISDFISHLRNILVVSSLGGENILDFGAELHEKYKAQGEEISRERLIEYINEFSKVSGQLRYAFNDRILLETTCIKLCHPEISTDSSPLEARVDALEKRAEKAPQVIIRDAPTEKKTEKPREIKPKAVPEDLEAVIGTWRKFCSSLEDPLGSFLGKTFAGYLDNNILSIVCLNEANRDYLKRKDSEIKDKLCEKFNKEFTVKYETEEEYNSKHLENFGEKDKAANDILKKIGDKLNGFDYEIE